MFDIVGHTSAQNTLVKIPNHSQTPSAPQMLDWFSCAFSKYHYRTSKSANTKVAQFFREHISFNYWHFKF
jgi:hypothetical protein